MEIQEQCIFRYHAHSLWFKLNSGALKKTFLCFAGIDVSKAWLDIALLLPGSGIVCQERIENTAKDIRTWLKSLYKSHGLQSKRVLFCMEHTGRYNQPFLKVAVSSKINVWVELPVQIKKSQGLVRGKTDKWDAVRIAQYAYRFTDKATLWEPLDKTIAKIKAWQSKRHLLVKTYGQLCQEDKMDLVFEKPLNTLKQTIDSLDSKIEQSLLQDPELELQYRLLTSIPGIGLQTAMALIVTTRRFTRLTERRKLSCYVGAAPFPHQSGSSISRRKRVSKIGDMRLKGLLNLCAWNAIRSVPELKAYYTRKVQEGKNKMSVINAVRNKIIAIILSVIKRGTPFVKNFRN